MTNRLGLASAMLLFIGTACGGASPSTSDAAPLGEGGAKDDAHAADECDLVAQDCPVGARCNVVCEDGGVSLRCVPDPGGTLIHGQECAGMSCVKGARCVGRSNGDGGLIQTCVKYCDIDTDCPTGKTCGPFQLACPPTFRPFHDCAY